MIISTVLLSCSGTKPNYPTDAGGTTNGGGGTGGNGKGTNLSIFPIKEGNYWIYETYQLDSNSKRVSQKPVYDSVVVTGKTKKSEKDCYIFADFRKATTSYTKSNELYYYIDGQIIYTYSNYITLTMGNQILNTILGIEDKWLTYINYADELWRLYKKQIDGSTIPFVTVTGKLDVISSKEFESKVNTGYYNLTAQEYIVSFKFLGTMKVQGQSIPINIDRDVHYWYADKVGLIKSLSESYELALPLMGGIKVAGEERELMNYNLK